MINIAIIGGGPNGMYTLNGLLDIVNNFPDEKITVTIFDKYGNFGSGWAHSPYQPKTSMLNRIVGQLSYSPDYSNPQCNYFSKSTNITFSKWCQDKYELTRNERYNKKNDEFPTRELYGESLFEIFNKLVNELSNFGVKINTITEEITKIKKCLNGDYLIETQIPLEKNIFDIIILATGHQESKNNFFLAKELSECIEYYNFAYPLFDVPNWKSKRIGIIGMGLTAIDTMLYYTENKGGYFQRNDKKLVYYPSGNEPVKLFALSRSGYFTYSRPHNLKEMDIQKYEHNGYFFTRAFVDKIRDNLGRPAHRDNSSINYPKQLDFDCHIFPVLILELQLCYYRILFGKEILDLMFNKTKGLVDEFSSRVSQYNIQKDTAIEYLTKYISSLAREIIFKICCYFNEGKNSFIQDIPIKKIMERFLYVIYGKEIIESNTIENVIKKINFLTSPWGHNPNPETHLFNWDFIVDPIKNMDFNPDVPYCNRLLKFMELDRLQSEQGNLDNPYKGACDDVFRDLRQTVVYAVDFGGITPTSYQRMLKDFYSVHNRAANGNCIELMEKMEALIEAGIIDVTYAKSNIQIDDNIAYLHSLSDPGNITTLEVMIDAKLHNFDIKKSKNSLFSCLIDEGLASYWNHKDFYGISNPISSFNISRDFQFINNKGGKEAIFCIGQPSEGAMFFQNGSIRPNVNHHVANDVLNCIDAIKKEIIKIKNK
ncbi:hypothetical protein AM629_08035 [Photorhabdus heterorhabditis]|uniref:FAD-dependent urate hydroxylase HpyO/Asp monooxygenase CreE-like FAD/NAD(P)-binding domain-containing protein n=1 Tax=Photorhabdus heterorhabditis TaxID=880156 RepID=A0ABR5KD94_9GAMM|nr:FAD/NAD(P)-binding protein [Photorhabdus heterorhabditis]KOY62513.1 hypothetical protein AM629_08035 [Photorhabdus heterorhabditis]